MKKEIPLVMQLLGIGLYVALSLILPTVIGFYLDSRGPYSFPVWTLSGLGLGTLVMVIGLYKLARYDFQDA
ncbi:MAG: hypothetical protein NT056_02785 [Proteobacteria bacterium]|nr:hypothetical protein [Pseudomonadota bacterium]